MDYQDFLADLAEQCRVSAIEFGIIVGGIRRDLGVLDHADLRGTTFRVLRELMADYGVVAGEVDLRGRFVPWLPLKCALDRIGFLWPLLMSDRPDDVFVFFHRPE